MVSQLFHFLYFGVSTFSFFIFWCLNFIFVQLSVKLFYFGVSILFFSILMSQLYFCSIKCLKLFYFFYFDVSTLFLFNQVFKLLIFIQTSVSCPIETY